MPDIKITISTVNWYSCNYLDHLFANLINKAEHKDRLNFLVVDNTNGDDKELYLLTEKYNVQIIKNNPVGLKGSYSHASGLNLLTRQIKTEYALIVDPDIHIFKNNWDSHLLNIMKTQSLTAIGTTYPQWQLGKYRNFPNPVFCFYSVEKFLQLNPDWMPFESNLAAKVWDFIRRNILRLGLIINRRIYENLKLVRTIWSRLEKYIGVCSKDTGWKIAKLAKQKNIRSIVFNAAISSQIQQDNPFYKIAKEFELYCLGDEPIMAHKYSTCSMLWKTKKGKNKDYWYSCIEKFQNNSYKFNNKGS